MATSITTIVFSFYFYHSIGVLPRVIRFFPLLVIGRLKWIGLSSQGNRYDILDIAQVGRANKDGGFVPSYIFVQDSFGGEIRSYIATSKVHRGGEYSRFVVVTLLYLGLHLGIILQLFREEIGIRGLEGSAIYIRIDLVRDFQDRTIEVDSAAPF